MDTVNILRLKEVLREKNITGKELAEKIGLTETSISRIVKGIQYPKLETLTEIANALGVHITDLFTPDDEHFHTLYIKDENGNFKEFGKVRKD